ncbi:MAG: hypothetical protein AB2807_08250, partial [Candidatus Sedimenticola endophacoides]
MNAFFCSIEQMDPKRSSGKKKYPRHGHPYIDNLFGTTVNLRSGKIPITWHRVRRHFQNIEYRPGI